MLGLVLYLSKSAQHITVKATNKKGVSSLHLLLCMAITGLVREWHCGKTLSIFTATYLVPLGQFWEISMWSGSLMKR